MSVGSRPKIPHATQTPRRIDATAGMIHELEFDHQPLVELLGGAELVDRLDPVFERFRWLISLRSS